MADLITGNTDYPTTLDTQTSLNNDTDDIIAEHINGPDKAIIAIENALGILPQGTAASVKERLAIALADGGGLHLGTAIPSPALSNLSHFFFNTLNSTLYIYNVNSANYDVISTATVLASYLRNDTDATMTGKLTFNPVGSPFLIGANAHTKVTDLDADKLDGLHAAEIDADKVDGQHAVLNIGVDHNHSATGAQGGIVDHTSLASKGTTSHADIDAFIATKAAASGLASLNADTRVVQPALTLYDGVGSRSASPTPGANIIPVAKSDGTLDVGFMPGNGYQTAVGSTNYAEINLGTVIADDFFIADVQTQHVTPTTGLHAFQVSKTAGTAVITAGTGVAGSTSNVYLNTSGWVCGSMLFRVVAGGTLTIRSVYNGAGSTVYTNALRVYFLRKQ